MKVHLSENIAPSAYLKLKEHFEIVSDFEHPEEWDAVLVRQFDIDRALMERAKKLKIISVHGTGWDMVDMDAARELGIKVVNVPGDNARSVAELAVSFMLSLSRQLKMLDKGLAQGRWTQFGDPLFTTREVTGKALGLIGTGSISNHVAKIMLGGFDMKLLCYNPHKSAQQCRSMGYEKVDSLQELFRRCEYINVSVPLNEETYNMIDASVLSDANPELVLVSTSRGGIINEKALYEALSSGRIKAAACDIFENEPPEKTHPLLTLDNFIGTFHIGACTVEALDRVSNKSVDNIIDYLLK